MDVCEQDIRSAPAERRELAKKGSDVSFGHTRALTSGIANLLTLKLVTVLNKQNHVQRRKNSVASHTSLLWHK